MEKLIELIANFMKEIGNPTYEISKYHYDDELKLIVVSQNNTTFIDSIDIYRLFFGSDFIQRLVDNDKININEGWDDFEETNLYCNSDFFQLQQHYSVYESLLMLLAIQDTPIKFLISVLK